MLGLLGTVIGIIRSFGALGADLGTARYALLFERNQRGAGQYGGRPGHRNSGDDFLRLFPRPRATVDFGFGIRRYPRSRVAFVAVSASVRSARRC